MVRSLIDVKVQIKVYKKYKSQLFQENGKAHSCSNEIYNTLIEKLEGMTRKSIQTSINRNVKEILADDEVSGKMIHISKIFGLVIGDVISLVFRLKK